VGAGILGLDEGQAVGRLARDLLGPWVDAGTLRARAQRRELARGEAEYARGDGARITLGISVSPLVRRGPGGGGFLLVFQDLTEIKNLEAQVRTREKLAAVGEVAAQLAHEIRNPLGAIQGSAQLLLADSEGDGGRPSEDRAHLLQIIRKESQRLSENLNQFLLQARGPARSLEPVDLGPVIADAVELLRHSPEVKPEHCIDVDIAPGPLICLASADRIRQVFWNLTRNALEAMPAGGTLAVALSPDAERLTLTVSDDGFGLDGSGSPQAFAPLPARPGARVGLGLAIVFQIVREHHGDIAFQRTPAGGTAVSVFLPLVGADVAA
jgi:two-component system sensor histidine kinase PilS (NtrC family)